MSADPVTTKAVDDEEVVVAAAEEEDSSDDDKTKQRDVLTHQADDYPMRSWSINLMGSEMYLNPFTSFFGFAFLWALSIWCMVVPDDANAVRGCEVRRMTLLPTHPNSLSLTLSTTVSPPDSA